ncbi:hypothetical protein A3A38_03915 [Candidatus Kaiserbacteria bacterium RIFCSPLOWO2_01_FULL_53_17]|uniref:VCBS repeat-containing protein n=1 Tax=Candidatus Kaiserbacteria bacterium RIFCSPLOWO2_01_FULL_53_17 TaxID=1798511 RepID=A0A1F6EHW6_9BACT|nr:MAG: hypothetical protein A3A38_03915 [Candidatus Kaiserbacteria bacterium RIFCSPLOWO2_01_FULL_53_17]
MIAAGSNFSVADINADGKQDMLWQNSTTGSAHAWLSNGTASFTSSVSLKIQGSTVSDPAWKLVSAADVNADGKQDLLWQRSTSGTIAAWSSNGTASFTASIPLTLGGSNNTDVNRVFVGLADVNADCRWDALWWNGSNGNATAWLK